MKKLVFVVCLSLLFLISWVVGSSDNGNLSSEQNLPVTDSSREFNAFDIQGTWRIDFRESSCSAGGRKITTGGDIALHQIAALDYNLIQRKISSLDPTEIFDLISTINGLEYVSTSTTAINGATCPTDGLIPELRSIFIFHFNEDAKTGFVTENWSFGENTACQSCATTSFSDMILVSSTVGTGPLESITRNSDKPKTKDGSQIKHILEETKDNYISN